MGWGGSGEGRGSVLTVSRERRHSRGTNSKVNWRQDANMWKSTDSTPSATVRTWSNQLFDGYDGISQMFHLWYVVLEMEPKALHLLHKSSITRPWSNNHSKQQVHLVFTFPISELGQHIYADYAFLNRQQRKPVSWEALETGKREWSDDGASDQSGKT